MPRPRRDRGRSIDFLFAVAGLDSSDNTASDVAGWANGDALRILVLEYDVGRRPCAGWKGRTLQMDATLGYTRAGSDQEKATGSQVASSLTVPR